MYIVTGSTGLIGFSTSEYFLKRNIRVIGIDNDMRSYFFGKKSSNKWKEKELKKNKLYSHYTTDIRNRAKITNIFKKYKNKIKAIIHTAAQPSHDWALKEPITDFDINAKGTINLLEAFRKYCPEASFIFTSTPLMMSFLSDEVPVLVPFVLSMCNGSSFSYIFSLPFSVCVCPVDCHSSSSMSSVSSSSSSVSGSLSIVMY